MYKADVNIWAREGFVLMLPWAQYIFFEGKMAVYSMSVYFYSFPDMVVGAGEK